MRCPDCEYEMRETEEGYVCDHCNASYVKEDDGTYVRRELTSE